MRSGTRCIRLRQVQDVGLVVQDYMRAPGVVAIYLVDPVTCKEEGLGWREGAKATPREGPHTLRLAGLGPAPFYSTNFPCSNSFHPPHQD